MIDLSLNTDADCPPYHSGKLFQWGGAKIFDFFWVVKGREKGTQLQ